MGKFKIGDEEYTEEVNTTYDQDQTIGDDPQALNTELSNSEPIDAPTGGDFYTIQTGGPKEGLGEYSTVWKQLGYESYADGSAEDDSHKYNIMEWEKRVEMVGDLNTDTSEYWKQGQPMYNDLSPDQKNIVADNINKLGWYYERHADESASPKCSDCGQVDVKEEGWNCASCMDMSMHSESEEAVSISSLTDDELLDKREYMHGLGQSMGYLTKIEDEIRNRGLGDFSWRKDDKKEELGEKLNKDGTGTAVARRGINPNNKKHGVMKFDYVSQSDCEVCRQYDGKTFGRDSPNRPVIPRLESQGKKGSRPYTHPNCKCRWIKVFNEVNTKDNMIGEGVDKKLIERCRNSGVCTKEEFDALTKAERNLLIIAMLKKDLGWESESEEFVDLVDPLPLASMAQIAFNAIKDPIKHRLKRGEAKVKATEAQEGPYGIQPMLDQIVNKSLGKEEKEEIEEEVSKDFTLDNLLQLVADKLAKKAAKKMGLESHKVKASEYHWMDQNNPNRDLSDPTWVSAGASHQMNRERTRRMSDSGGYVCQTCRFKSGDEEEAIRHLTDHPHHILTKVMGGESHKVKASERFLCEDCHGDGWLDDEQCPYCNGTGTDFDRADREAEQLKNASEYSSGSDPVMLPETHGTNDFEAHFGKTEKGKAKLHNLVRNNSGVYCKDCDELVFGNEGTCYCGGETRDCEHCDATSHDYEWEENKDLCPNCDKESSPWYGESDGRTDEEQIEYAKKHYGYIPFGEEHPNYKNDPERDSIGQSKNFKRNGDPITKYDWGNEWPHPDYTRDPDGFYEDGTPKTGMSIPELTQQINNMTGGMLNRKRKEDWESYSVEGERFEGNCGSCGNLKRDYRYRCSSCGAMGTDAKSSESIIMRGRNGKATCNQCGSTDTELEILEREIWTGWQKYENWTCNDCGNIIKGDPIGESIAEEWTTYDEEDYKVISPDVLTDKKKDEAEEYKMDTLCDTCGKPYEDHDRFSTQHEFKFPEGWADESVLEMEDEFDELDTARSIMKKQVDTYNEKPTPEERYDDPHITMGYNWQKGGESVENWWNKNDREFALSKINAESYYVNTEWEDLPKRIRGELMNFFNSAYGMTATSDYSTEVDPNHFADPRSWYQASDDKEKLAGGGLSDDFDDLPDWNRGNIAYAFNAIRSGEQVDRSDWYPDEDYYKGESLTKKTATNSYAPPVCVVCNVIPYEYWEDEEGKIFCEDHKTEATEGGKGSGRRDHRPWMLGAELGDVCATCMISTEWEGSVCKMCGTDSKESVGEGLDDDVFDSVINSQNINDERDAVFDVYGKDIQDQKHKERADKDKADKEWEEKQKKERARAERENRAGYRSQYAVNPDFGAHNRAVGSGYAGYPY